MYVAQVLNWHMTEAEVLWYAWLGTRNHLLPHHCQGPHGAPHTQSEVSNIFQIIPWACIQGLLIVWGQVSPGEMGAGSWTYLGSAQYG